MKKLFLSLLIMALGFSLSAQKIKLVSGSLDFLQNAGSLKTAYDYSDMAVGKFDNEADYVQKKVDEYNEKEAGKGDEWKEKWINDREERFEPSFEELLNKYLGKEDITVGRHKDDAPYILLLKTIYTEPGFNIYITRKNAEINTRVIFKEKDNPDNVLAVIEMDRCPGRSVGMSDYDTGSRIMEAYAKCGKELGKYLRKKAF